MHQLAVGERNEDVTLFVNPDSQQTNSLKPSAVQAFADSADIEMETIRCVTLDSFVAEYKSGPIDVLKIDVQGLEGAVLRGARTALETVEYLFIEVTWLDLEGCNAFYPQPNTMAFSMARWSIQFTRGRFAVHAGATDRRYAEPSPLSPRR